MLGLSCLVVVIHHLMLGLARLVVVIHHLMLGLFPMGLLLEGGTARSSLLAVLTT